MQRIDPHGKRARPATAAFYYDYLMRFTVRAGVCAFFTMLIAAFCWGGPSRNELFPAPVGLRITNIARDSHGLLWLATNQGVYRFDGSSYQKIPGYPFDSAFFIAVSSSGAIWAGGPRGLARYQADEWKAILRDPVEAMTLSSTGLWLNAAGLRLIGPNGSERKFPDVHPNGELVVDTDESLWFPCAQDICTLRPPNWRLEAQPLPISGDWKKILPLQGGRRLWLSSQDGMALVEHGVPIYRQSAVPYDAAELVSGLDPYQTARGSLFGTRLNLRKTKDLDLWSVSPTTENCSSLVDDTTRWFCAGERIGRSVRGSDWETWAGGYVTAVEPNGLFAQKGQAPLAMTFRGIARLDPKTSEWQRDGRSPTNTVLAMSEDGFGGYWLETRDEGLMRTDGQFSVQERFPKLCPSIDGLRALLRDSHGRTWVGGKFNNCFFKITGSPRHWTFQPQSLPGVTFQTVEMHADREGRPWVGYQNGLAYLDDVGKWKQIKTSEPIGLVRSFTFDGSGVIWLSHRKPGFFTKLTLKGSVWQVERFPAARYGPADTWFIRCDSRGWVWRGTPVGVQVARPGHYEPNEWLALSPQKGLADDGKTLNGWAEDDAGNVWLAGPIGVTRLRPSLGWFDAPRDRHPRVARVQEGEHIWLNLNKMPKEWPVGAGGVEIDLSSMDANPFQAAPLRYRILPRDVKWIESQNGRIKLNGLSAGSYRLEAAYTGEGPTPLLQWSFQLTNSAGWWRNTIFVSALGLLIGLTWWRRQFLEYWFEKPFFLLGRSMHRNDPKAAPRETVAWTNYSGHTFAKRYHLNQMLARGGFAVTYLADDLRTEAKVVVKVLHRTPGQEGWSRGRFAHEVAALHTVRHPGVITLLDSWISAEGEPCLAMPFIDGPTLRKVLDAEIRLKGDRAGRLIEQLGAALAAIHSPGIVHRDLKPENIIVSGAGTSDERAIIIDLGTSAARGPERDLEQTLTLTGSLHYLAPERLANQYSPASDIYALGVIVLEMITGKRLTDFPVSSFDPNFVRLLAAEVGEALADEIASALQPDPGQRPQDAEVWAARCSALLGNC